MNKDLLFILLILFFIFLFCVIFGYYNTPTEKESPDNLMTTFQKDSPDNLMTTFQKDSPDNLMTTLEKDSFPFHVIIINMDKNPGRYDYVKNQLDNMNIHDYERFSGVDGFNLSKEELIKKGVTPNLSEQKGLAGCAASHISVWKHIVDNNMDWTLILEDDAHFHPDFKSLFGEYWKHIPTDAIIIYPGFCTSSETENTPGYVIETNVMCNHGYMLSSKGAKYLLENILPVNDPIDIVISNFFDKYGGSGSYIFNGNASINGIIPNTYKTANGRRCMFNGIIYQNHEECGSTVHQNEIVY